MKAIQLISPVDGSVYAERMPLSREAAIAAMRKVLESYTAHREDQRRKRRGPHRK